MAIVEQSIVKAVSGLPFVGNEEGLIPAFGLYLTRHYASYYNRVSFAALHHAERENKGKEVRAALTDAGHQCAFFTFGGIMLSQEWQAVVQPMIESREDWVRGMVSVVNALGWGVWKVDEITAGKRLTVSIDRSYESVGYVADYPQRKEGGVCFLAQGGVAGIMNLLYHGDITATSRRGRRSMKRTTRSSLPSQDASSPEKPSAAQQAHTDAPSCASARNGFCNAAHSRLSGW